MRKGLVWYAGQKMGGRLTPGNAPPAQGRGTLGHCPERDSEQQPIQGVPGRTWRAALLRAAGQEGGAHILDAPHRRLGPLQQVPRVISARPPGALLAQQQAGAERGLHCRVRVHAHHLRMQNDAHQLRRNAYTPSAHANCCPPLAAEACTHTICACKPDTHQQQRHACTPCGRQHLIHWPRVIPGSIVRSTIPAIVARARAAEGKGS